MTDTKKRVLLGRIKDAHGIRGDVTVTTFTEDPEAIASYGPLEDETGTRSFRLKVKRVTSKGVIVSVEGVTDRNAAEALKGTELFIERSKLPTPDDGEFYHDDLVGLRIENETGAHIGDVVSVANYGAGDLIEVRLKNSDKTEFVPFNKDFVPDIDLTKKRLTITVSFDKDEQQKT